MGIDDLLSEQLDDGTSLPQIITALLDAAQIHAPPVDLASVLANWPHLDVSVDDLDGDGYLIELGARAGQILLRRNAPLVRRRFTLAHELGHWVMNLSESTKLQMSASALERWCDEFARELLIPAHWLANSLMQEERPLATALKGLPALYNVSWPAMLIQLSRHDLVSAVAAGDAVQEYPAPSMSALERAALVRATVRYRDTGRVTSGLTSPSDAVFFRRSSREVIGATPLSASRPNPSRKDR